MKKLVLTLFVVVACLQVNAQKFGYVDSEKILEAIPDYKKAQQEIDKPIYGQLTIPEYQRPYVWKEKQVNRLLNDLIEYQKNKSEEKPLYYLGSIILHQDGDQLKVIDGQQRITTFLLLQKLKDPNFKSGISYSNTTSISQIKYNLSYLKSVLNEIVSK